MRRFELVDGTASKFWEVEPAEDNELNVRWGRVGTAGQSQTKSFANAAKAQAALAKLIQEKTAKGYSEVSAVAGASIGRTDRAERPATVAARPQAVAATPSVPSVQPDAVDLAPAAEGVPPWLARGEPLLLDDARKLAYASRRHPKPVVACDVAAVWNRVRLALEPHVRLESTRPAVQRLLERIQSAEPAPDAEADPLLLALVQTHYGDTELSAAFVNYLVACHGLTASVDVFLASQRIQVETRSNASYFTTTVRKPMGGYQFRFSHADEALRTQLAVATEADWQLCADRIEAALPDIDPTRQPTLAMLLPDRPAVSNALAVSFSVQKDPPDAAQWLLLTATDPAAQATVAKLRRWWSSFWDCRMVSTVLVERGVDAVAVLKHGAEHDVAGDALTCIGTPEAVTALAKVAGASQLALARLSLAVDRWPEAALLALAPLVAQGSRDAVFSTLRLNHLLRTHGASVAALRPWMSSAAQGLIDRRLALLALPLAGVEELPAVLAAPPWLAKVKKKAARVLALEPLPLPPVEQWAPGEKEKALSRLDKGLHLTALVDALGFRRGWFADNAENAIRSRDVQSLIVVWRALLAEFERERYSWFRFRADAAAQLPADVGVPFWNAIAGEIDSSDIGALLATYGLAVLPGLTTMVRSKPAEYLRYAQHFGAVELAQSAARAFSKLKTLRAEGRDWLLKYPEHAACGLMAPALGKGGEARDCAGSALRWLQAQGFEALLFEVAGRYDNPAVVENLRAVLEESPLDRFPNKRSKLPPWWQPSECRRPVLLNGKALPDEALEHLGEMLSFPSNDEVYAGIAVVKEACQPDSLADFAWDAFSAWLEAGGPSKEGWGLTALGWLGNDDTARRLTPFIRAWPGESVHARAVTGLDVLAAIGTDVALMLLNGIAQKVKFKGLQDKAREKIDAIAEARELSTEELEDRLAPDLGLDEQGTLVLDFGPRSFKVAFDESLKPCVREVGEGGVQGARLADLPKPKKTDDEALAKEAVERFKLLKKDARTIASQQLLRLEVAMCARRRWTPALFRMFLVEHPLLRYIVQRLIWGVYQVPEGADYGGTLVSLFRVAEDGRFTNAEDDAFELPEGESLRVGLPHALEIPAADAAAFGQVFADYELLQPFAQIGRDTYTLTDEEIKELELVRWNGVNVPTGKVLGLVNRGWRRGQAQDGGGIWYFTKPLGADKVIELQLSPGIIAGLVDEYPEQTLGEVIVGKASNGGEVRHPESFATLDAIAASELIRDLEALRS